MTDGNFLAGFQDNLGWLQQVPNWLSGVSSGSFDMNSGILYVLKMYGQYIDVGFVAVGIGLSYFMYRAWLAMRDEV